MKRLRELRKSQKLTLQELSKILGVSPQVLSRYELCEREADYKTTCKIAEYFDVSVDYLLGFSDYFYPDKLGIAQLSSEELKLIDDYRELNQSGKRLVNETIKTLLSTSVRSGQKKNDGTA